MASEITSLVDLEKIIKDTEFENSKLLSQIDEEIQITRDLDKQIGEQNSFVSKLEDVITRLDEETASLHTQYKHNKDTAMSLRKSTYIIDSHVEQLQKKLLQVVEICDAQSEKHRVSLEKYSLKWSQYKAKWESNPLAKELDAIKKQAIDIDAEVLESTEKLRQLNLKKSEADGKKASFEEKEIKTMNLIVDIATCRRNTDNVLKELQESQKLLKRIKEDEQEAEKHSLQQVPTDQHGCAIKSPGILNGDQISLKLKENREVHNSLTGSYAKAFSQLLSPIREELLYVPPRAPIVADRELQSKEKDPQIVHSQPQQNQQNPTQISLQPRAAKPATTLALPIDLHQLQIPQIAKETNQATLTSSLPRTSRPLLTPQLTAPKRNESNTSRASKYSQLQMPTTPRFKLKERQSFKPSFDDMKLPQLSLPQRTQTESPKLHPAKQKDTQKQDSGGVWIDPANVKPVIDYATGEREAMSGIVMHGEEAHKDTKDTKQISESSSKTFSLLATRTKLASEDIPTKLAIPAEESEEKQDTGSSAEQVNLMTESGQNKTGMTDLNIDNKTAREEFGMDYHEDEGNEQSHEETDLQDMEYEVPLEEHDVNSEFNSKSHARGSPFHFSPGQHAEYLKKFTNSPGDGFLLDTRPMFSHSDPPYGQQPIEGGSHPSELNFASNQNSFFTAPSFVSGNSCFHFENAETSQQKHHPTGAENPDKADVAAGNSFWSSAGQADNVQGHHGGFTLFGSSAESPTTNAESSNFSFGFASNSQPGQPTGGFSLF